MSSYISPAPQGDDKATGAYSVAIAAQAGGTNADGHATDSAGNLAVDFVWRNFPLQPNDERRASVSNTGGSDYDRQWSATTQVTNSNLAYGDLSVTVANALTKTVPADNHVIAESGWASYPAFANTHSAAYIITQASGDGTTQTYTAPNNFLKAGDTVNITGTGLDGTNLTVATANRYTFTVTASGTGSYINISGKVRYSDELTANDGAFVAGVDYVKVPSVLGFLTASAQDVLNDAELTVTTASAATNAAKTVTAIARTSGSSDLVFTASGAGAAYGVGTKVVVSGFSNSDAFLNGTYAVTANATNTFTVSTPADTSAVSLSGKSGAVVGLVGTIKAQGTAAGQSVAVGATVTTTPWAAAS